MMQPAPDTQVIDVEYLGTEQYIACGLLAGDEPAIVDPGPTVSLPTLEKGLARAGLTIDDLAAVLLTHIHLDHAGAAGTIVARNPRIQLYVHERGAGHMIDPEKLLASAKRLYGDQMDELWGEFRAVQERNVQVLQGGETIRFGDRALEVAHTPGHAWHHVSYLDTANGTAFVGDTTGIRIANEPLVLPITPPPDIDLEIWETSLQKIEAWKPEQLFVTHFGPADGVEEHVDQFRRRLYGWADTVRDGLERGEPDEACIEEFTAAVTSDLENNLQANQVVLYQQGGAPEMSWKGLARYWRKKSEKSS